MSEALKKAQKKYRKEKIKRFTIDFSPSDMELWEHIQNQAPKTKQTYVKNLIRSDLTHEKKEIYLIFRDSSDDACEINGCIIGTEEDAEKYCDQLNENCKYEWEEYDYIILEKLTK